MKREEEEEREGVSGRGDVETRPVMNRLQRGKDTTP